MAIGEAFVNVRADLKPFAKDLEKGLKAILKEAERKIVAEGDTGKGIAASLKKNLGDGVDEGLTEGGRRGGRRGSKEALSGFQRFFAALADFADDGLSAIPAKVKASLLLALIGAALAAAPLVGSVIAAAVTSALTLGVIAGGIALASQFKVVNDSFRALGSGILEDLRNRAAVFIEPLLRAAGQLQAAFRGFGGTFSRIFVQAAANVQALTAGVIGFLRELLPRIQLAVTAARPLLNELFRQLPAIGKALGDFFLIIAQASPEAVVGLRDFVTVLLACLTATALVIKQLTQLYFILRVTAQLMSGDVQGATDTLVQREYDAALASGKLSDGLEGVNTELTDTAIQAKAAKVAISGLLTTMLSSIDGAIGYEEAYDNLQKSIKEGNKEFRITEENGRRNVAFIKEGILFAGQQRDAEINKAGATEESVARANAAYESQIAALEKLATSTGHETEQLKIWFAEARNAPDKVSIEVETPGLNASIAAFRRLGEAARAGAAAAAAAVRAANGGAGSQNIPQHALGTITSGPEVALIGEAGREAVIPDPATNPGRAMQISNQFGLTSMIADALGAGRQTIVNVYLGTKRLEEQIDFRIGFNSMQQAQSMAYGPRPA